VAVYSAEEIRNIAYLAERYRVTLIVDQLYSRLLYGDQKYHHLRGESIDPELIVTVMGPSKTESLSGFRLGVAFGATGIIDRMEKLQAIVSLRAAGYNQAVLRTWFSEPQGWMKKRIALHEAIRNCVVQRLSAVDGLVVRTPQAGSYVFPQLPKLAVSAQEFVHILRIQADVIVASGSQFGTASHGSIRLNYSQDYEATLAAVNRIVEMIERYKND